MASVVEWSGGNERVNVERNGESIAVSRSSPEVVVAWTKVLAVKMTSWCILKLLEALTHRSNWSDIEDERRARVSHTSNITEAYNAEIGI